MGERRTDEASGQATVGGAPCPVLQRIWECVCVCVRLHVRIWRCHRRSGVTEQTDKQAAGWRQRPHACHDTPHARELHTTAPTLRPHNEHSVPRITHQRQQQCEIFTWGQKVVRQVGGGGCRPGRWGQTKEFKKVGLKRQTRHEITQDSMCFHIILQRAVLQTQNTTFMFENEKKALSKCGLNLLYLDLICCNNQNKRWNNSAFSW